jgi:hypothetical protein
MTEAAIASGTSVNFYQTTQSSIPEDSHLYSYVLFLKHGKYFCFGVGLNFICSCFRRIYDDLKSYVYFREQMKPAGQSSSSENTVHSAVSKLNVCYETQLSIIAFTPLASLPYF